MDGPGWVVSPRRQGLAVEGKMDGGENGRSPISEGKMDGGENGRSPISDAPFFGFPFSGPASFLSPSLKTVVSDNYTD